MRGLRPAAGRMLLAVVALSAAMAAPVRAEQLECATGEKLDVVVYDWRLRGALSFFAGLKFPTSGSATLATLARLDGTIAETELRIIADAGKGERYRYRSIIDLKRNRSIESTDGYEFGGRTKSETTTFDYDKGRARRVRIDTKRGDGETVRFDNFSGDNVKDVLTSIHHIRKTSGQMKVAERHGVFSGGKIYEVLITPGEAKTFQFEGRRVEGRLFTITATPENRDQWPGDVKVWITTDADRLPVEIDLGRSMASLKLQAVSRFRCP